MLRSAGCVFADDEARVLRRWASGADELDDWTARRVAGEPLEHIVGRVEFGGLDLRVGPGVFVPRQRSLLLAAAAVDLVAERPGVFVEVCCGVAPIAATVAHRHPATSIVVSDIDVTALDFATLNVPGATAVRGRFLDAVTAPASVIAAVPPYVPDGQARLLPGEAGHEAARALFGGSDGLDAVRALLGGAASRLVDGGAIAVEMHRDQTTSAAAHAARHGLHTRTVHAEDRQTAVLIGTKPERVTVRRRTTDTRV
ncbi:methylase of HemK family protein [Gordonia spumicola]|uniref:Methylase of HemK family protein n=1 Tax=Gordonia spumicola TaxID=589161 RepID=A0A7I9VDN6_9ACTN|nr:SAM-dependent methyltransferase [Gordonia spumicola]GEE03213.1 methylase of HemK family protein [Gordonia spumicola]